MVAYGFKMRQLSFSNKYQLLRFVGFLFVRLQQYTITDNSEKMFILNVIFWSL